MAVRSGGEAFVGRTLDGKYRIDRWTRLPRLLVFVIVAELHARPGAGDLAFQVRFHEKAGLGALAERCRFLAAGVKRSCDWARLAILASALVVPFMEGCVLFCLGLLLRLHPADLLKPVIVIVAFSLPLAAVIINPIHSSALAILYFRARQAAGEDVSLSAVISSRL